MSPAAWLDPVRRCLDELACPAEVYFHDHWAGPHVGRLERLLGLFSAHGLSCDVAVDPDALDTTSAGMLAGWGMVDGIRFHQLAGPDVVWGRVRLREELGGLVDDVFTAGARGCTPWLADVLVELGFVAVVQATGTPPLQVPGLVDACVAVDWAGPGDSLAGTRTSLGLRVASALSRPGPVGIGLHHVSMDHARRDAVDQLLGLLASHPGARATTIGRLFGPQGLEPSRAAVRTGDPVVTEGAAAHHAGVR